MAEIFCEVENCLRRGDVFVTFANGEKLQLCEYHGTEAAEKLEEKGLRFESSLIPTIGNENRQQRNVTNRRIFLR